MLRRRLYFNLGRYSDRIDRVPFVVEGVERSSAKPLTSQAQITITPSAGGRNITLERLSEERILVREPGLGTRQAVDRLFAEHGLEIEPYMKLGSSEVIKQGMMAGLGISVLSRHNLRR